MIFFTHLFLNTSEMTARIKEGPNIRYANAYYIIQYGKLIHIEDLDLTGSFEPYFFSSEEAKKTIHEQEKDLSLLWNRNAELIKAFQKKEEISSFLASFIKKQNVLKRITFLTEEDTFEEMKEFYKDYKKSDVIDFYTDLIAKNMKIQKKINETIDCNVPKATVDKRYEKLKKLRAQGKIFFDEVP